MNLRNQLLALFCFLVFVALGFLYFHVWVVQKPFGVILFVGDGLVTENLAAARLFDGGAEHHLTVDTLPHLALVTNYAADFAVPDSPAAATAIATGEKVNNGSIAVGPKGRTLTSILELARQQGRAVGVVTNGSLTDGGVAAFYAHAQKSTELESIAAQFAESAHLDVALGGGAHDFTPEASGGQRKDGRDLLLEMKKAGAEIFRSKAELEDAPIFTTAPRIGLFSAADLSFSNQIESGSAEPSLSDMVRRAIEFLELHRNGYILVVDAELVSRAAEQNDGEHVLTETIALDRAIATALRYAGDRSVVMAVGRHATGGMALNGYPLRQQHGVGLLGVNAFGYPAITWGTGPKGPRTAELSGTMAAAASPTPAAASGNQPAAYYAPTAINTAEDVIAVGQGPGTEALHGVIDNTEIFQILQGQL